MAFIISGGFAGVAGSLFAIHGSYVPLQSLYWTESGEIVIMTVLGGTGTLFGPMLGAGLYLYVENIVSGGHPFEWIAPFWHLTLGLLFVVAIWLFPRGVGGGFQDLWWFLKLAADDRDAARDHAATKVRAWIGGLRSFVMRVVTLPKRLVALVRGGGQ
jgi:branched-chain amino acid transport system permease protein